MGLFGRGMKEEDLFATDEQLIVFDNESGMCEIYDNVIVTSQDVEKTGVFKAPIGDCKVFTGRFGRVYVANAKEHAYIENGKRLAQLELSVVLKQLTHFKPEKKINPNTDMKFWLVGIALLIAIIL